MERNAATRMPPAIFVADTCLFGAYRLRMALALGGSQRRIWANRRAAALQGHRGLFGRASWCNVASR
jgi:hypothetical protein